MATATIEDKPGLLDADLKNILESDDAAAVDGVQTHSVPFAFNPAAPEYFPGEPSASREIMPITIGQAGVLLAVGTLCVKDAGNDIDVGGHNPDDACSCAFYGFLR